MASTPLFVVAIDFGTTFSGYAHSSKSDIEKDPPEVFANESWVCSGAGLLSRKTPTSLLLTPTKTFCAFGYEAEEQYNTLALTNEHTSYFFFRRFKMKLNEENNFDDDFMIEDELGKPLPTIEVFSKSIKYMIEHFLKMVDRSGNQIKDNEICWVVTVPAIWSDNAKLFMRKAAIKAGINGKQLRIGLEPEVASIYCQHLKTEDSKDLANSPTGTEFMVIDIGGGTADITVQKKLEGGKLEDVIKASGGPWGGTAVDQQFIQLLKKILGGPVIYKFRQEFASDYFEMMQQFEVIKRKIDARPPSDEKLTINVKMPVSLCDICNELNEESIKSIVNSENFPHRSKIGIIGDKLTISKKLMQELFMNVIHHITEKVKSILDEAKNVSFIILAGGFAESPILQTEFQENFKTGNRRVVVAKEASLSVLKGAVIFGHKPDAIKSRKLRYTYGVAGNREFDRKTHPENRKVVRNNIEYCSDIFDVFITQGTLVKRGHEIQKSYSTDSYQTDKVFRIFSSQKTNPSYIDEDGCYLIRELDMDKILPETNKEKYRLQVTYIFGDTEIQIEIRGKNFDFVYNDKFDFEYND